MPNLQQLMSEEIRRLARKELKSVIEPLRNQIVVLKKALAEQNKRLHALEKAQPVAVQDEKESIESSVAESGKSLRITPERIKKLREKLFLNQIQFATILGVSIHSVNRWESGKSVPRLEQKMRIAAIRDMGKREFSRLLQEKDISEQRTTTGIKSKLTFNHTELTAFREAHKLTKTQLAALLGVSQFSVGHWESGKSVPRAAQKAKISAMFALADEQIQLNLNALPKKPNAKQVVAQGKEQY